jgi:peptidoglycan hydrolase-like protein with peptidoglycan-binding domain
MIQARNYTPTSGRQIDLIVIHSMEAPEKPATAENVANWFAGANAPRASAHWCHDVDSSVRCVNDKDVAWHAPGVNHNGIGHELSGYARQTEGEWLDNYGRKMLANQVAPQVRADCTRYGVPVRFVDAAGLKAGQRGITTHHEVSQAFRRSTHWDPGPHFPMGHLLALVKGAKPPAVKAPSDVAAPGGMLRMGSKGDDVADWQRILVGAGHRIAVDGDFGPATEAATEAFQRSLGVSVDGVVGPETRKATARLLAWLAGNKPARKVPPFPGTVRRGDTGSAVRAVQARLKARGWRISVDGAFGPQTEGVVRKFQAEKGLTVDGIAGRKTWRALWTAPVT